MGSGILRRIRRSRSLAISDSEIGAPLRKAQDVHVVCTQGGGCYAAVVGRKDRCITVVVLFQREAGKPFPSNNLTPEQRAELSAGMKAGFEKISEQTEKFGKDINGWLIGSAMGNRAFFKGDWTLRAAAAKAGIYGNDAIEATYPLAKHDADGNPLDGSKHNYTTTFPPGQLPPVNAFWSITMYDGKTQLLIENPINRYLINSPMLADMKKNADGSLTLYVQKDSPGKDKESNWLPAPNGAIYLVIRLYWPKAEPPSVLPPGDGTWEPPSTVAAK